MFRVRLRVVTVRVKAKFSVLTYINDDNFTILYLNKNETALLPKLSLCWLY